MGPGLNWVLAQQAACKFTYLVHIQCNASNINSFSYLEFIILCETFYNMMQGHQFNIVIVFTATIIITLTVVMFRVLLKSIFLGQLMAVIMSAR